MCYFTFREVEWVGPGAGARPEAGQSEGDV